MRARWATENLFRRQEQKASSRSAPFHTTCVKPRVFVSSVDATLFGVDVALTRGRRDRQTEREGGEREGERERDMGGRKRGGREKKKSDKVKQRSIPRGEVRQRDTEVEREKEKDRKG